MTEQEYKQAKQVLADAPECTHMYAFTHESWYVPLYQCDERSKGMSQLVIEYDFEGGWRRKYYDLKYKKPVALSIPKHNYGKDIIIGATVDRREEWRAKLNFITKNAEYEITVKGGEE